MFSVKTSEKIKTTKAINGETVSYALTSLISVLILISLKQFFKVFISLTPAVSAGIAFVIAEVISFLLEKRFVFAKSVLSSNLKQALMFIFRAAVNLGLYKMSDALFGDLLSMGDAFVWLTAIVIAFFFNYFFDRLIMFDCAYEASQIRYSKVYILFYNNRYVLLSAAVAMLCLTVIYIVYTVFPFGDYTVMRMDLYHQYGPLFAELYDRVVERQSFLYSWVSGGGSSFLGNYFNYLSSPLSALIFLFDKKDISYAITLIVSVKCVLSAASFSYYIKTSQKRHTPLICVFGVFYAFSAYFLAYYWNVMWLDAMFILPFIALGIEKIINKGSVMCYILSMALLFLSSYYMGFMCCIFAVIYFLGYYFISSNPSQKINDRLVFKKKFSFKALMNNKFFNRGVHFALSSIAAAALCAVVLIPVFIMLRSSSATSDSFPTEFTSYFNIFDFITSHLAGLETTIRSSGDDVLPNVYSGMLGVLLIPLFVVNKKIKFREKAVYVLILLFFLFSFDNNCLNFIWHAFHFPNDLPFRFSYMYSFILLLCAYRCAVNIKGIEYRDIWFVAMGWILFIVIAQKMATTKMTEPTIYISIAFIIIWAAFLYLYKKGKLDKAIIGATAIVLVFSEVLISDTGAILITQNNKDYSAHYDDYTQAIEKIRSYDDGFYREELTYLNTRMDPSYYGYNGMSVFSSMAYEDYSQLQYELGMFGNRINSYTYNTQTPVYNMMHSIKYLIKADSSLTPDQRYYDHIFSTENGNTQVYQNKYWLPIAYAAGQELNEWEPEEGDPFKAQGDYFAAATGYSGVFTEMDYLNTSFDGMSGDEVISNGTFWFSKSSADDAYGNVEIVMTPKRSGNAYLYVTSPDIESIEINSKNMSSFTQPITEPYILDLGYCEEGEEISVIIDCSTLETSETYAEIYAYTVNDDILNVGYDVLSSSSLNIESYSDTKIKGTINVEENSVLYTSIPYDDGWRILIDGEPAETYKVGGAMLAASIKPGEHTVELKYSPKGLKTGIIISAATAAGICGYVIYKKRKIQAKNRAKLPVCTTFDKKP